MPDRSVTSSTTDTLSVNTKAIYKYIARQPFDKIPYYYIPQIMTQLLCTGQKQVKFVSWTPTRGMNVFTVERNDEYIHLMLLFIQKFYQQYIVTKIQPPDDLFFDQEEYQRLLELTLKIAEVQPVFYSKTTRTSFHEKLFFETETENENSAGLHQKLKTQSVAVSVETIQESLEKLKLSEDKKEEPRPREIEIQEFKKTEPKETDHKETAPTTQKVVEMKKAVEKGTLLSQAALFIGFITGVWYISIKRR